jgi:hypothetical protein
MTTTTTVIGRKKTTVIGKKESNKAEGEEYEDYTLRSDAKKDETFHDVKEIKTFRDEAPIPTSRLRDLLNRITITTSPKFRIKRISCPR